LRYNVDPDRPAPWVVTVVDELPKGPTGKVLNRDIDLHPTEV
jgi:hypothetical protein